MQVDQKDVTELIVTEVEKLYRENYGKFLEVFSGSRISASEVSEYLNSYEHFCLKNKGEVVPSSNAKSNYGLRSKEGYV